MSGAIFGYFCFNYCLPSTGSRGRYEYVILKAHVNRWKFKANDILINTSRKFTRITYDPSIAWWNWIFPFDVSASKSGNTSPRFGIVVATCICQKFVCTSAPRSSRSCRRRAPRFSEGIGKKKNGRPEVGSGTQLSLSWWQLDAFYVKMSSVHRLTLLTWIRNGCRTPGISGE